MMYLKLYNGMTNPDQSGEDGEGIDGPLFGPYTSMSSTYCDSLSLHRNHATDEIRFYKDLLFYDGVFYGEFAIRDHVPSGWSVTFSDYPPAIKCVLPREVLCKCLLCGHEVMMLWTCRPVECGKCPGAVVRKDIISPGSYVQDEDAEDENCDEDRSYSVLVSNVGVVSQGVSFREAHADFIDYCENSNKGYGRVAGERVTLMHDGEIVDEMLVDNNEDKEFDNE